MTLVVALAALGPRQAEPMPLLSRTTAISELRSGAVDASLTEDLRRSPTDARRWLALAWIRGLRGAPEAAALARHAQRLDPAHPRLAAESGRLVKAFSGR